MASLGHKVFQAFHDVADRVMPTQTGSNFLEKGMLTPEEFVLAGDQLVHTCATWEWCGGDPAKARPYMPKDKQYLVTRGVPSLQRARSIQDAADADASEMVGDEGGGGAEDEWVVAGDAFTRLSRSADGGGGSAAEDEFEDVPSTSSGGGGGGEGSFVAAAALPPTPPALATPAAAASDSDDEYADLADFEEDNLLEPVDAAALESAASAVSAAADAAVEDNIVKTRTYDVSITYDNYYRTPRVWLYGYNPRRQPLSAEEIFEDIVKDYVQRTVTIEAHPHAVGSEPHASVHPCRHAAAMKRIVDQLVGTGDDAAAFDISSTLFMFLKFMQSIMPTIAYDFTISVG